MKKFWEFYKKNHRLKDSLKTFVKRQNILEYDFLRDWIKRKEHQQNFSWKMINENFRFKNIVEQLLVPNFIKNKKGFAVLGKIIRIVGTINLKRLKVHVNPFLHTFPNLKLHSHITMQLKGIGKHVPAQLNLYRPYKLSNVLPFNLRWHMNKASFALLYFKNISKKAFWNQSAQIKYMFLTNVLQRMYDIKEKSKKENKIYIFENIKKDLTMTEFVFSFFISNIKKKTEVKIRKLMNSHSFFLENLNLVIVKPFFMLNNFLCKFMIISLKKKKKFKKKKKEKETETEIQKKLDLNRIDLIENVYLHPSKMSNRSNWRRLKQTIIFGFRASLGWKTMLDSIYEEKSVKEFIDIDSDSMSNLYFNPSKKIERRFWLTPSQAFLSNWEFKLKNWFVSDKKEKKNFRIKNFLGFLLNGKKKKKKKKNFKIFHNPYLYMSILRKFSKEKKLENFLRIKWNINNVDNKLYKLIDFIYGRKLENHNIWDYKWKIKKLGQIHQLKIKNIINIKNKDIEKFIKLLKSINKSKIFENIKGSFSLIWNNLPNIIKIKFDKYLNLLPYISDRRLEKFKLNFRNAWLKFQSKHYNKFRKIHFTNSFYFTKQDKLQNKLLIKSFINEEITKKLVIKEKKYKKLSNIYNYIKPSIESLLIKNNKMTNSKKDLLIQKKIGLNYYEKNYNKIWKLYLRRWTAKHQMDNMTLWLVSFYKILNEFFTIFFLWFYRQKYWTEAFENKISHKRSSNSYRTKYQLRNWYSFLQENLDFINFDSKLPLVKDIIKYIFIKNLDNKDLIYKYIYYKMFLSLINLNKIRNEWLFEPFKNLYLLIIIKFFRKILLMQASFDIYKDLTTIFSTKRINKTDFNLKTSEDDIDLIFSLTNFRIYYKLLYNNNFESKTKIWSINMPRNRAEVIFYIKENIFTFINWKFLYLFKLRQLITSFRFKQKTYKASLMSGYRNKEVTNFNSLRHKKFQVSGYRKFSISRAYKNEFVYSNLIFYNISDKSLSDNTYLHNFQVFYNGYNTLKRKTFL